MEFKWYFACGGKWWCCFSARRCLRDIFCGEVGCFVCLCDLVFLPVFNTIFEGLGCILAVLAVILFVCFVLPVCRLVLRDQLVEAELNSSSVFPIGEATSIRVSNVVWQRVEESVYFVIIIFPSVFPLHQQHHMFDFQGYFTSSSPADLWTRGFSRGSAWTVHHHRFYFYSDL